MRRFPIVAAAVLAIASGCGGSHPPSQLPSLDFPDAAPPPPDGAPVVSAPVVDAAPAGPQTFEVKASANQVVRLTKGKGKGAALRYAFAAPSSQVVDTQIDVGMDLLIDGKSQHQDAPTQTIGRTIEVTGVDASGTAMTKTTMDRGSASDAAMTESFEQIKGTTIAASVDARGRLGDASVTSPAMDAGSAASVAGLIRFHIDPIVLPDEEIATGGTWKVSTHGAVNNIECDIDTTYKLVKRTATEWQITGTTEASAGPQTIPAEALGDPSGGTIEVRSMTGKGTLKATIDPTRPAPVAEFSESYDATLAVAAADGKEQEIHLVDTIKASVTARAR